MTNSILRYRDRPESILTLDPSARAGFRELSRYAEGYLAKQDLSLWEKASALDHMGKLSRGARFLNDLGRKKGPSLLVPDCVAHHVFMICIFLALRPEEMEIRVRQALRFTILIFAESCPVDLSIASLPLADSLPTSLRLQSLINKHYPAMQRSGTNYVLTLADAFRLLITIERAMPPGLVPLMSELRKITEGLRRALRQTGKESLCL